MHVVLSRMPPLNNRQALLMGYQGDNVLRKNDDVVWVWRIFTGGLGRVRYVYAIEEGISM